MLHMKKKARYAKQQESIQGQIQNLEAQARAPAPPQH